MDLDKQINRLGKRVLTVYQDQDQTSWMKAVEANHQCREGCSSCCYLLVLITIPEAVAIAEHLLSDQMWLAEMEDLMARFYRQIKILEGGDDESEYAMTGLPCAFLDVKEGRCRVYEQRPSACRYHFVTSSPEFCRPALDGAGITKLNMSEFEAAVTKAAAHVSKQVGTPAGLAPMAIAVLWALKALTEGKSILDTASDDSLGILSLKFWQQAIQPNQIITSISE